MVKINGKSSDCDGQTIEQYLSANGYDSKRVAVERNGEIIPKAEYAAVTFSDGDSVEIVSFVGGG